jgi:hypothetical protein
MCMRPKLFPWLTITVWCSPGVLKLYRNEVSGF